MNLITLILIIFSFINVENNSEILESKKNSNFSSLKYRNVGPIRGGRVTTVHGVSSKMKPDPYDPEGAKKLMKEAGYGDGFEMTIWTGAGTHEEIVNAIGATWLREFGVKVSIDLQA